MEVKFQIGLKDKFKDGTLSVAVVNKKDNSTICLGSLKPNKEDPSNPTPIFTPLKESTDSNGTVWYSGTLTCLKALAKNFLEDAELVIKSTNPKDAIIEIIETRLYELIHGKDKDGNDIILDLYDINSTDVAKKFYYYYLEGTSNPDGTAPYIYKAQVPCPLYEPVYGGWAKSAGATEREYSQFEKVRTIYGQQSNRFNLLQELAETFKCWARFKIYHNADGSIERDEKGKPKKTVYFSEKIGQQLSYGFTYGIDLNTIRRTQSSSELVTKTIVLANYNDNAPNGTCSIVDSEENYPRENFVLNFDYYVNHGLLDGEALNRDLYYSGAGNDYIGYYTKLHRYNIEYLSAADRAILLRNQEVRLLQQSVVYDGLLACAVKERDELIDELAALGGDTLDPTKTDPKASNSDKSSEIITAKWIPIQKALQQIKQYVSKPNQTGGGTTSVLAPSDQNANLIKTIKDLDGDIATYKAICLKLDAALAALQLTIEANTANRDRLLKLIKELHQKFYNKYSNYIQEGSWTSEDYIDPNIYYYDALSVAYTSSRPQVQYDIAVTRVSELPEFKFRRFHVGDTTYIQDTDFFGYEPYLKNDKVRTPYKEAVLISEISINFEEPDKDTITVQNYKTQFEDLFQRINATTQSLQYAQGGYNRAAGVVNGKGELKEDILQNSLLAAQDIVTKATDESVVQDNTGITLTSLKNLDQKLKITSGGIVFSDDGGETWTTMMKAGQIGVQFLSAGSISTSKITIMDGTTPAFRWDTNGITAYWSGKDYLTPTDNPVLKMNRFVRFDKFGIYGYNNNNDNDNTNFVPASEEEIRSNPNSMFSLTWSGLLIRSVEKKGNTEVGSIEINNKYDIVVKKGDKNKIQIGRLNDNGNYGIRICGDDGKPVLETIDDGSLWLRESLSIGTGTEQKIFLGLYSKKDIAASVYNQLTTYQKGFWNLNPVTNRYQYIGTNEAGEAVYNSVVSNYSDYCFSQIFNAKDTSIIYENGTAYFSGGINTYAPYVWDPEKGVITGTYSKLNPLFIGNSDINFGGLSFHHDKCPLTDHRYSRLSGLYIKEIEISKIKYKQATVDWTLQLDNDNSSSKYSPGIMMNILKNLSNGNYETSIDISAPTIKLDGIAKLNIIEPQSDMIIINNPTDIYNPILYKRGNLSIKLGVNTTPPGFSIECWNGTTCLNRYNFTSVQNGSTKVL